ncbi:hypothetical protein Hdeb2414_s0004g00122941 [Helianthus debilis subsp. tardiflorus]
MEQKRQITPKKACNMVRLLLFMIRKKISKTKLMLDVNMVIKRGKIAGKALHNLMVHNNRKRSTFQPPPNDHYEFSCTNSPVYPLSLFTNKDNDHDEIFVDPTVIKALEMLTSAAASPAVSGFGKSQVVRQLRITDSPFPLCNDEEDSYVDEAAEEFIINFYDVLRRQS